MISLSQDPNWADVTPMPQLEEKITVVNIDTTDRFKETMGYFRAIMAKKELSRRAFDLTEQVIDLNSANYTAWHYRRQCLALFPELLDKEIDFVRQLAADSPKNYQIWHHRRTLLPSLLEIDHEYLGEELESTRLYILNDNKNYHVWTYRQWILSTYATPEIWQNELLFVDELLNQDVRNNSAWNQRHFVIFSGLHKEGRTSTVIHNEISFCIKQSLMAGVPNLVYNADGQPEVVINEDEPNCPAPVLLNESVWNYLESLIRDPAFKSFQKLAFYVLLVLHVSPRNRFAYSLLVEMLSVENCLHFPKSFWTQSQVGFLSFPCSALRFSCSFVTLID